MEKKIILTGNLGVISKSFINGWAARKGSDKPVMVKLLINNKLIATEFANKYRKDLKDRGIHATGKCGFRFNLNDNQKLKTNDKISVVAGKNSIELNNSPKKYSGVIEYRDKLANSAFKEKIFFMHIAKSAGTSLNAFIESHYSPKKIWTHLESNQDWKLKALPDDYDFLSGHLRIQVISRLLNLNNFSKITILRDPLEHIISHISWVKFIGKDVKSKFFLSHDARIQNLSKKMNAIDFSDNSQLKLFIETMDETAQNLFDNCQTRYFLANQLKENIKKKHAMLALKAFGLFDMIGIAEEYNDFTKILSAKMNWQKPNLKHEKLNVQKSKPGIDPKNPETREILSKLTFADEIIYNKAKEIFTKYVLNNK